MFIRGIDKETGNTTLLNVNNIIAIIECEGLGYWHILTNIVDPDTGSLIYYQLENLEMHPTII